MLVRILLEKRAELLEKLLGYEVYVPANVLEETLFEIIMLGLGAERGSNRLYELKEAFEKSKELPEALMQRMHLLSWIKDRSIVLGIDGKVFDEAEEDICQVQAAAKRCPSSSGSGASRHPEDSYTRQRLQKSRLRRGVIGL